MAAVVAPIPQNLIDYVAQKGTYVVNINPRQILINNVGIDGYEGGGNLWVGESAADLDKMLVSLATYPYAKLELDTGSFYEHWSPASVSDIRRLRDAFFALYGIGKQNWYPPPLQFPAPGV